MTTERPFGFLLERLGFTASVYQQATAADRLPAILARLRQSRLALDQVTGRAGAVGAAPPGGTSPVTAVGARLFQDHLAQLGQPTAAAPAAVMARPYGNLIASTANRHGVDPALVAAVVEAESGFNPNAVSSAGAKGLMQLMDATARGLGVSNSFDPAENIEGGVKFLSQLLQQFEGDVQLALAAYNAGPGAVQRYGGVPPYQETQQYVRKVQARWQELR